ncbi:MAG: hypothetical protein EOO03_13580, partial [Chitinophagaceae bacterium]
MRLAVGLFFILHLVACHSKRNEGRFVNMSSQLSEEGILATLDNSAKDGSVGFIPLGHAYSYLIDSRVNLFKGSKNEWAIAVERLGYNPRAGLILLDVYFYGNCLKNLEVEIDRSCGYNSYEPINRTNFLSSITDEETLKPEHKDWIVRNKPVN